LKDIVKLESVQHCDCNFSAFQKYQFKHDKAKKPLSLRIYECHVGIATEEPKVGTYKEFGTKIIPRIVKQGKTSVFQFCSHAP
jgi:1,4-alpha-glucan branching enzyme